eukprot:g3952.t1
MSEGIEALQRKKARRSGTAKEALLEDSSEGVIETHTLNEVAQHATSDDCWIIVEGQVLDVTQWLEKHPGGASVLLERAGTDCTAAFKAARHSIRAENILTKMLVGHVLATLQTNAIKGKQYEVSASFGGVILQKGEGTDAEQSGGVTVAKLTWTPASTGEVTFYAMCIQGYGSPGYLRQESVTVVNSVACDSISNPSSSVCNDNSKYTGDLVQNAGDVTCQNVPCTKEDDAAKCCKEKEGVAPAKCDSISDVATFCGDNEAFTGALAVGSSSETCKSSTCSKADDSETCCAKRATCDSIKNEREFCSSETGELNSKNSDQYCKGAECKPADVGLCCKASGHTVIVKDDLIVTIQKNEKSRKVSVTAVYNSRAWLSIGAASNFKMVGTDAVVCSEGKAKRYLIDEKAAALGPESSLDASSCTQAKGKTILTFTRDIDASKDGQVPLNDDAIMIYAHGEDGTVATAYHQKNFGSFSIKGPIQVEVDDGSVWLWLHVIFMILGWGCLLPFGVAWARYERLNPKKSGGKPIWFAYHYNLQYTGWFLQILGFIFIAIYKGDSQFQGIGVPHMLFGLVIVVIGTLQPLNAFFRPHGHNTIDHSRGCSDSRTLWEYLHKSMGSIAVICGPINCVFGIYIVQSMGRDTMFLVSLIMFILLFIPVLAYALYKQIRYGKQDPRPVATGRKKSINLPSK